jgi:hypothetical protein
VSRPRKAKRRPATFQQRWKLNAAISLLKHLSEGGALENYPLEPLGEDDEHPIDEVIRTLEAIRSGEQDARVAFGQAVGRGGDRKGSKPDLAIALAYHVARAGNATAASACKIVRDKLNIRLEDSTIRRIARAQSAAVQYRRALDQDFETFDSEP